MFFADSDSEAEFDLFDDDDIGVYNVRIWVTIWDHLMYSIFSTTVTSLAILVSVELGVIRHLLTCHSLASQA